jgi:hypothetical protein
MHLFVDISGHGYGHLAITAPVLNRLLEIAPDWRLTVRSALPHTLLAERIGPPFTHLPAASDFGFRMIDALHIDRAASAAAYRQAHADYPQRLAAEIALLAELRPDRVLSNISDLPLAAAARLGIPADALCSLNWADLFAHYFGDEAWAAPIHQQLLAAYRSARAFLRITPGMAMPELANTVSIGALAARGQRHDLGLAGERCVLVALGGISHRLPIERWPRLPGVRWLVAAAWQCRHPDALVAESFGLSFTDLLCSVDAVLTKPGYGTFTEAACNGTPVLYQRRVDWPEQDCLIDWLEQHGNCREIAVDRVHAGKMADDLAALWAQPRRPLPAADGAEQAARWITADAARSA